MKDGYFLKSWPALAMITLRAKGTDSKWYNAKETVTVVR